MPRVSVKTGTTQDGDYDLDLTRFTMRERAYIREIAGVRPPDYAENWFGGDPKTVIATVAVMMQRAGKHPDLDVLLDADDRAITIDYTDLEQDGDAGPPDHSPSSNDELGEKPDEHAPSGSGSNEPSAHQESSRKGTGSRSSVTA